MPSRSSSDNGAVDYESCRKKLEALVEWYRPRVAERNEATTRLHLIDRLFFECLGWSKDDVVLEEHYDQTYADYVFSCSRRILIVEAKKEGDYFELPVGKERLEYSIASLCRDYPILKSALEQAAGYAQARGAPFAAVSNGHQLIAFVATRSDGTSPMDGRAVVFPSLEFMIAHFLDLWQALSAPGVQQQRLHARLIATSTTELPPKLSASIPAYPGVKGRNIFQTNLQILGELVLEDISRSPELEETFLQECYCQSGALSQHALTSKAILKARYDALFDMSSPGPTTVPMTDKKGRSSELLAEGLSQRPILLIGDVGVGKTTFIRRLLKVDAAELFENAIALYIDLGTKATLAPDLANAVLREITCQLRELHGVDIDERNFIHGIYHSELSRFRRGVNADLLECNPALYREKETAFLEAKLEEREEHVRTSLEHLYRARKKQIVLFLDNADQRDYPTQQKVFLIAEEFAKHWPAMVFMALRPETFHRSRREGVLKGYHPKAFTISPPRTDRVIDRRLQFAQKITSGEIPIPTLRIGLRLQHLDSILTAFRASLRRSHELVECIDNIAGGNVRQALDLVRAFFGSGHVDTEKIAKLQEEKGSYYIPLHEFLRAIIYGDCNYYDPNSSPVANLFDVLSADPKEHFLLPLLLSLLHSLSSTGTEGGFIDTGTVYDRLQEYTFTPSQIDQALVRAYRSGLVETSGRQPPLVDGQMPRALRATTIGVYHILRLCRQFTYLDAIAVDLPVFDETRRNSVRDVHTITDRLDRACQIKDYLNGQWHRIDACGNLFDWKQTTEALSEDIQEIQNCVTNAQEQRPS